MGMKSRPKKTKSRLWYRTQIRRLNRSFKEIRTANPQDERLAKIASVKDELIDELVASCGHDSLLASPPEEGFGMMSRTPARGCLLCGEVEYSTGEWITLDGPVETVDRRTFSVRIGLVIKDLGINL